MCDMALLLMQLQSFLCTISSILISLSTGKIKKWSGSLNHLEQNVFKGLSDGPTVSELAVLALFGQAISKPYMCQVQLATLEGKSIAELGNLHNRVKVIRKHLHCKFTQEWLIWTVSVYCTAGLQIGANLPHLHQFSPGKWSK